jgi:hypothetical protein
MKMGWRKNYIRQKGYFLNILREYKERADIRVYLEILLSLLTISVFSVFALRPTLLTIAELLREIEAKRETLQKMNNKITNLTQAQILYDQNRSQILLLRSSVPDYPQPDVILRQFEGITARNGLNLINITFDESPIKGNPARGVKKGRDTENIPENALAVKSNFSTGRDNYAAVTGFIKNFEDLRLPLNIHQLALTTALRDEEEVLIVNLDGNFLYNQKQQ